MLGHFPGVSSLKLVHVSMGCCPEVTFLKFGHVSVGFLPGSEISEFHVCEYKESALK